MATELARKLGDIKQYHTKIPQSAIEDLSDQIYGILGGVVAILEHYVENPRYLKFNMVNELHKLLKETKHKYAKQQLEKRKRRTKTVVTLNSALPQSTTTFAHTPRSHGSLRQNKRVKRPQSARNMVPPMKKMMVSKSADFKKSSKRRKRRESHSSHKSMGNMLRQRKGQQRMHKSDALNNYNHRSPEAESDEDIDIEQVIKRKQREKRKRNLIKNRIVHKKEYYDHDAANDQIYSEIEDEEEEEEADAITHIKKHRKRRKKQKYEQEETLYEEEIEQNNERKRGRRKRRKKQFDEDVNDAIVIKVRSKSHTPGQRHRRYSISEYTDWDTDDDMNEMNQSVEYFRNLEKKYKKKKEKKRKRKKKKKREKMMKLKRMAMQKMKSEREERKSIIFDKVLQTLDISEDEDANEKIFDLNGHTSHEQKEESKENNVSTEHQMNENGDDKKEESDHENEDKDVSIDISESPQKKTPGMESPEFLAYFEKFILENSTFVAAEMQGLESAIEDDDESDEGDALSSRSDESDQSI